MAYSLLNYFDVLQPPPVSDSISNLDSRLLTELGHEVIVTRHQTTNGGMFFAKGAPNLMQRLPCLPTTPYDLSTTSRRELEHAREHRGGSLRSA
jgi:hypothetical protein